MERFVAEHGKWTSHRFEIADGVFTLPNASAYDFQWRVASYFNYVSCFTSKPPWQMRMLDLGCLEGGFAIEMGKRGVHAVGIEVREENLQKARFATEMLGLKNVEFVKDDVRSLSASKYGMFDITFACGILYHMDAASAFDLVAKIAEVTTDVALIDTHVSLTSEHTEVWRGMTFEGRTVPEHDAGMSVEQQLGRVWASVGNLTSFWLTENSLVALLRAVGFTTVFSAAERWPDRLTFIAVKPGRRNPGLSA